MKKFIIVLTLLFSFQIFIWAIPSGKYCAEDESYVIVSGQRITLYIGLYSAGSFSIVSEEKDGTFTFSDESGVIHKGKWYEQNGITYLKLGARMLQKCD